MIVTDQRERVVFLMTIREIRENMIKKVADEFKITPEQAIELINSSFEIGEPEWVDSFLVALW